MRNILTILIGTICFIIISFLIGHYLINWDNASFGKDFSSSIINGIIWGGLMYILMRNIKKKISE